MRPSTSELTRMISRCAGEIGNENPYATFTLVRTNHEESYRKMGDEQLDALLTDDMFHEIGRVDITGGPLNALYDAASWAREVERTIERKRPGRIAFYLRKDASHIAARVLVTVQDFYGGLTHEEAAKRYGDLFPRMERHLDGITLSVSADGKVRIPYEDLDRACREAKGEPTSPEMWD